jgi:hypothetical protein
MVPRGATVVVIPFFSVTLTLCLFHCDASFGSLPVLYRFPLRTGLCTYIMFVFDVVWLSRPRWSGAKLHTYLSGIAVLGLAIFLALL